MSLIDKAPQRAFDMADGWSLRGGGAPARHCAAAALLALGFAPEAAERLETLAKTSVQGDAFRAEIYAQAGIAWKEAGNYDKATAMYSAALTLDPKRLEYRIQRARVHVSAGNFQAAIDDLSKVLQQDANNAKALTLRATTYRALNKPEDARKDIDSALKVAPNDPEALLESGILFRLSHQQNRARENWGQALRQIDKDSDLANVIRQEIERMEIKDTKTP